MAMPQHSILVTGSKSGVEKFSLKSGSNVLGKVQSPALRRAIFPFQPTSALLLHKLASNAIQLRCSALKQPLNHGYHLFTPKAAIDDFDTEDLVTVDVLEEPQQQEPELPPAPCIARFVVPEFVTSAGQTLACVGSATQLGAWDGSKALPMTWHSNHKWTADVVLEPGWRGAIEFKLVLVDGANTTWEEGSNRLVLIDGSTPDGGIIEVSCVWGSTTSTPPSPAPITTSSCRGTPLTADTSDCYIIVPAPPSWSGLAAEAGAGVGAEALELRLVGSTPQLGNWDAEQGVPLTRLSDGTWCGCVRLPISKLVEAKIVVMDAGVPKLWEAGSNRTILLVPPTGELPTSTAATAAPTASTPAVSPAEEPVCSTHPGQNAWAFNGHMNGHFSGHANGHTNGHVEILASNGVIADAHALGANAAAPPPPRAAAPTQATTAATSDASSSHANTNGAQAADTASAPAAPKFSAVAGLAAPGGGDFVVIMHWGATSSSQVVYREAMDRRYSGRSSPTAATSLVHFTVPALQTAPGQHVVIVGSLPQLGMWSPANGLKLEWGPGNRWTGAVELPLVPIEFKLVLFSGSNHVWEPSQPAPHAVVVDYSGNRFLDLGELVAAGSMTGAGDIHTACYWGETARTAAVVVPKPPPALVVEPQLEDAVQPEQEQQQEPVGGSARARSGEYASSATTVILDGSDSDHAKDEALIKLLSFMVSSNVLIPADALEAAAAGSAAVSELRARLADAAAAHVAEVEALKQSLADAMSAQTAAAARTRRLEGAVDEAAADVAAARTRAAEAEASHRSAMEALVARHQAEMAEARSGYEARILDIQRGYEARILELQQHESRILELQQQHTGQVAALEEAHAQALAAAEAKAAQKWRVYEQQVEALQRQARSQAASLHEQARQHETVVWELQKQLQETAAAHKVKLEELEESHAAQVAALERQAAEQKAELLTKLQDTVRRHNNHTAELDHQHAVAQEELEAKLKDALAAHSAEIQALRQHHQAATEAAEQHAIQQVSSIRAAAADAAAQAAQQAAALNAAIDRQARQHAAVASKLERRNVSLAEAVALKQLDVDALKVRVAEEANAGRSMREAKQKAEAELSSLREQLATLQAQLQQAQQQQQASTQQQTQQRQAQLRSGPQPVQPPAPKRTLSVAESERLRSRVAELESLLAHERGRHQAELANLRNLYEDTLQQQQAATKRQPSPTSSGPQHQEPALPRQQQQPAHPASDGPLARQQQQPRSPFGRLSGRKVFGGGLWSGESEDTVELGAATVDPWATPAAAGHATVNGTPAPAAVAAKFGNNIVGFQSLPLAGHRAAEPTSAGSASNNGHVVDGVSAFDAEWLGFPHDQLPHQQQPHLSLMAMALFAWLSLLQQQPPAQQ